MSGHGHVDPSNKKIALLISILALVLAFSETLGKGAQTAALSYNIEASNLWSFFQAKTIRGTTLRTAAEALEVESIHVSSPEQAKPCKSASPTGRRPSRATTPNLRRRRGEKNWRRAPRSPRAGATVRSRPTTTTNLPRRRSRSRSCSPRRRSSPASSCSAGSPPDSG